MKSLLIDVERCEINEVDITNYKDFYTLINCTCFDVAHRQIGHEKSYYDIFVDDMGLLKNRPIISAVDGNCDMMLVGNLVITKTDAEGEQMDLSDNDIQYIRHHIMLGISEDSNGCPVVHPVLTEVRY
jgi:hypothetical protein